MRFILYGSKINQGSKNEPHNRQADKQVPDFPATQENKATPLITITPNVPMSLCKTKKKSGYRQNSGKGQEAGFKVGNVSFLEEIQVAI